MSSEANLKLEGFIIPFLRQIEYWHSRFEISRNIEDFDNADRNANIIREYGPKAFQNLSLIELRNLFWGLSAKQSSKCEKRV
jgi:hypothetical protein